MPFHHSSNVSADVIWAITQNQSAFLVKRSSGGNLTNGGGVQFSKDPLNLTNVHSRKQAGYVNDKAVGVVPAKGDKGGVTLITKTTKHTQRPKGLFREITLGGNKSTRKTYASIAKTVAGNGYRADLRPYAVARASAIRKSQRPAKDLPEKKLRGNAAKKAAAAKEE